MALFGDKTESQTKPWKYAKPYLRDSLSTISGLDIPTFYDGDLTAQQNPMLQNALTGMSGFGQPGGMGYDAAQSLYGAGMNALGGYGQAGNYLNQMQQQGAPQLQYAQDIYDQSFGNLTGGLQNTFDLGAQDLQRGFDWNVLPGLNMQNALGGGQGNTKFGQSGALGQAMANQNIQRFGTDLWQNAANQANQNAMTAGVNNLAAQQDMNRQMLGGYMGLGGAGSNMLGNAYNMGAGNLDLGFRAGDYQQRYDQDVIGRLIQQHMFNQSAPWQYEQQRLASALGPAQAFGTSSQSTQTGLGNIAAGLGGAALMGGMNPLAGLTSMFGGAQPIPNAFGGGWQGQSYGYW